MLKNKWTISGSESIGVGTEYREELEYTELNRKSPDGRIAVPIYYRGSSFVI